MTIVYLIHAEDIAVDKLKNDSKSSLKSLLQKYTNFEVPSVSSLRNKYVPLVYDDCLKDMRAQIVDDHIWVSIDSTSDSKLRNVIGFIVGSLSKPEIGPFLVNLEQLPDSEHATYMEFFHRGLINSFPNG